MCTAGCPEGYRWPTKEELICIREHMNEIGNGTRSVLWSSTEANAGHAYAVVFWTGAIRNNEPKANLYPTRCVQIPSPTSIPTATPILPTATATVSPQACPLDCKQIDAKYTGPGRLFVAKQQLGGDADCDGAITMNDYANWLEQWAKYQTNPNQTIPPTDRTADFDCSETDKTTQTVDQNDFEIWRESWSASQRGGQ